MACAVPWYELNNGAHLSTCQDIGERLSTIGDRLRKERERLGLNQTAFAEAGGVQKRAQINYEKDERHPDAGYLAAIAVAGVDVLYVLTGQQSNLRPSVDLPGKTRLVTNSPGSEIDEALMRRIVTMLAKTAKAAGRRWESERLMLAAVDVYKYLAKEQTVDDDKLERVLRLVVNR
ncbi:helix-turn-helix domain-containing protein [Pseudomonas sp.]|uniref:helix-turn-helix domain-containing protein n=1 Tax=Pseudomonas sp. TaxID=306 RepID=UPI0039C93B69